MGFSITASHLIWGLALLGAAGAVVTAFFDVQHSLDQGTAALDARERSVATSAINGTFCYDSNNKLVNVTATNGGKVPISLANTTVVADGKPASGMVWTIAGGPGQGKTDAWEAGELAWGNMSSASAPTHLTLATDQGAVGFLQLVTCPYLATIVVSPSSASLQVGGTQDFTASGFDQFGKPYGAAFSWTTTTGTIASLSDVLGRLSAGTTSGSYTVTATNGSVSASVTVVLSPAAPSTIAVTPNPVGVPAGGSTTFSATVYDQYGNVNGTASVSWSTSVGSITSGGVLTAPTTPQSGTATATSGAASGTASFTVYAGAPSSATISPTPIVVAAGSTQQFTATLKDAYGNVNSTAPVTWTTNAGSVSTSGLLTAQTTPASGKTVTATSGATSASADVTIVAAAPSSIAITPSHPGVTAGGTQAFTATVYDQYGNVNSTATVTWGASAGSITSGGTLTAQTTAASGKNVTATSGNAFASDTVDVIAAAPASITLTPNHPGVTAGGTQAFTAIVYDTYGNVNSTSGITWGASAGSITTGGVLTTQTTAATGKNVTAVSGSVFVSDTVDVIAAAPSSITITPNHPGVTVGATQQFTATVKDTYGNPNTTATVTWGASAGSITSGGLLTAQTSAATGKNVTAVAGNVFQSDTVDVIAAAPTTLAVSPTPVGVPAGGTQQFTATMTDQYGNANTTATVTWTTTTGSISSGGLLTAPTTPASGKVVTGTTGGTVSGTASVAIYAAAPASVAISPTSAIVNTTLTQQFTATATDQYGNVNTTATIAWNATRGSVSSSGLYTAPSTVGADYVGATTNGHTAIATIDVQRAVHISAIATYLNNATAGSFHHGTDTVDVRVTLVDHLGNVVSGASVTLQWINKNNQVDHTDTGSTIANGTVNYYATAGTPTGAWTAKVTSVTGTDLWWNTAADVAETVGFTTT